jgi:hypothetical protein
MTIVINITVSRKKSQRVQEYKETKLEDQDVPVFGSSRCLNQTVNNVYIIKVIYFRSTKTFTVGKSSLFVPVAQATERWTPRPASQGNKSGSRRRQGACKARK